MDQLMCTLSVEGNWYFIAQFLPSIFAALVFATLAWRTREIRDRVGLIWWLIPLEFISNAALAYDAFYWFWSRSQAICFGQKEGLPYYLEIDGETKLILGMTSLLAIWIYYRIREGK